MLSYKKFVMTTSIFTKISKKKFAVKRMANDLCRSKIMGISDKEICKGASVYSKHLFGQNQTFSKGLGFSSMLTKGGVDNFLFLNGNSYLNQRAIFFE